MKRVGYVAAGVLVVGMALAASAREVIFDGRDLKEFVTKSFQGETTYQLVMIDGRPALRADSHGAASGYAKQQEVDLTRTPYMHWSWRVDQLPQGLNERQKAGDDYAARIYVVVHGGLAFWRIRALNYVWASGLAAGTQWPNAFTANTQMIAVRSGPAQLGQWMEERRNVREDLRRAFGVDVTSIDAVALMTDMDNSGQTARAYYGAVYFAAE